MRRLADCALSALLVAAGCGSRPTTADGASGSGHGDSGPGLEPRPSSERRGRIRALEDRVFVEGGSNRVGRIDAWFSQTRDYAWQQVTLVQGSCVLETFRPEHCDPSCNGVCGGPNQCDPWPTYTSAGTLTITGLATDVSIAYAGQWYSPPDVVPTELFDPGDLIVAAGTGGVIPAFSVEALGVAPLVTNIGGGRLTLLPGRDHLLHWTPSGSDTRVKLRIISPSRGHGNPALAIIECDVADSVGEITIPAAMVDMLPAMTAFGVCVASDCGPSTLLRYTNGYAEVPGGYVELVVGDQMSIGVDHQP